MEEIMLMADKFFIPIITITIILLLALIGYLAKVRFNKLDNFAFDKKEEKGIEAKI